MLIPTILLAACCSTIGLWPTLVTPMLQRAVASWSSGGLAGRESIAAFLPLGWISILGAALIGLSVLSSTLLLRRLGRHPAPTAGTWDCGYARPGSRMQYTSSSFGQMLVGLLRSVLRPRSHRPNVAGIFPKSTRFESHVDDVVLEGWILPLLRKLKVRTDWIRAFQHGRVQEYILYVLVTLVLLLLWVLPLDPLIRSLFAR